MCVRVAARVWYGGARVRDCSVSQRINSSAPAEETLTGVYHGSEPRACSSWPSWLGVLFW